MFIDDHRDHFGVEPICRVLTEHGCQIAPSTYYATRSRAPSPRALRDGVLVEQIEAVFLDREQGPRDLRRTEDLAAAETRWH
jgi:putative transposase